MEREPPNQRLTGEELKRIAAETHREEEMIRHQRLATADEPGLVRRNFEYLMESLGHGEKQKLAAHLGVDLSNLSKWSRGDYGIREKHLDKIAAYFHLPSGQSLAQEPLFLSLVPSGASAQKNWLKSRIDATDPATLQKLFPALERLLKP
jgi:transcriptional regulator with XRE-family HTH domain